MPELPEVETIKRDLKKCLVGQTIEKICVYDQRVIKNLKVEEFIKRLQGLKISQINRAGKAIIIEFNPFAAEAGLRPEYLVIQLKMTGHFILGGEPSKETKLTLYLLNGQHLHYNDQRIFGRWTLVHDLAQVPYLKKLGLEPLNGHFSLERLKDNLKKKKVPIKTLLMNQEFIAGIGNIYASEILFASRIHPERKALRLKQDEMDLLYQTIIDILKEAVRLRGTSMRNYRDLSGQKGNYHNRMKVYDKEDQACLQCGRAIERIVQNGRSTFFCRRCQK